MTTVDLAPRRNLVARHLISGQLAGLSWLAGVFALAIIAVAIAIELLVGVTGSVWGGALQIPRWFSIGMGVYLTAVYLPVYVAHGRTRREIARGSALFAVSFAAALGVAATIGFAAEAGLYHLVGWSDLLPDPHPVETIGQIATTLATQSVIFLVWTTVGAMAGAAFYRSPRIGFPFVPVGLALIAVTTLVADRSAAPFPLPEQFTNPPILVGLAACLASAVLAAVFTWLIVRDIPLRSRAN